MYLEVIYLNNSTTKREEVERVKLSFYPHHPHTFLAKKNMSSKQRCRMYALKPNDLFLKKKSISILFIYLLVSFENSFTTFRINPKTCLLPTFRSIHTPHWPVHFLHHASRPVHKVDIFCNSVRLCTDTYWASCFQSI